MLRYLKYVFLVCLQYPAHSRSKPFYQSYILEYMHQFSIPEYTATAKKIINTLSGNKAAKRCHRDPVTEDLEYRRYLTCEIIMDDIIDDSFSKCHRINQFLLYPRCVCNSGKGNILNLQLIQNVTFFVALIREQ